MPIFPERNKPIYNAQKYNSATCGCRAFFHTGIFPYGSDLLAQNGRFPTRCRLRSLSMVLHRLRI